MKIASLLSLALLSTLVVTGCTATNPTAENATVSAGAPTTVAEWLTQAPAPTTITCSLSETVAPDAVATFNAISEKVASVYSSVHRYAQSDDVGQMDGAGVTLDAATVDRAVNAVMTSDGGASLKSAQDAVTEKYQQIVTEIEQQQKALTDYVSSLRTAPSIVEMTDPVQKTATLFKLGSNVKQLEAQLAEATRGAALILRERVMKSTEE